MRTTIIACLVVLTAMRVFAGGFGLKPGLWETHIVKQVVDGKDTTGQLVGATANLQKMMANMPPEQRARMEAMMKEHGGSMPSGDGSIKLCITPEMANRDKPMVDHEGHCQPTTFNRIGNRTTFEFSCNNGGAAMTGKGESVAAGDVITSQVDMTTTRPGSAPRVMHTETEMKFLGADCGDVKPITLPKSTP